jgi:signal transduction histidine kinase
VTATGADPRRASENDPGRSNEEAGADQRTVELIATVSHEIRSPLTTIKGFTKTMLDRWDRLSDDTKLEMLRAINLDADRVTRILTELLDVSRLEAGKLAVHLRPVLVEELAAELVASLEDRSTEHNLRIVPGDNGGLEVLADGEKLRQVLTNLIENAQKYSSPGTISVTCLRDGDHGVIEVSDGGPGVATELEGRLFEKFARRELPGSPSGTGLGLYISRGLVEAQGGEIGARFDESGSTFWVRLPIAPAA